MWPLSAFYGELLCLWTCSWSVSSSGIGISIKKYPVGKKLGNQSLARITHFIILAVNRTPGCNFGFNTLESNAWFLGRGLWIDDNRAIFLIWKGCVVSVSSLLMRKSAVNINKAQLNDLYFWKSGLPLFNFSAPDWHMITYFTILLPFFFSGLPFERWTALY